MLQQKNGDHDRSVQPGLYVAGDVRTKTLRQVVTAVSDGANAATTAAEYLRDINGYKQNIYHAQIICITDSIDFQHTRLYNNLINS